MTFYLTNCTATAPIVCECSWARRITIDTADVITRPTAEQIVAHNRKVAELCG